MEKQEKQLETLRHLEDVAAETLRQVYQALDFAAMEIAFSDRDLALQIANYADVLSNDEFSHLGKLFSLAQRIGFPIRNAIVLYALSPED